MCEKHPFGVYIPSKPRILILGSFPCLHNGSYGDWFYSGSGKSDFWDLLTETFNLPSKTKEQKEFICDKHNIAITDIASKIRRKKGNCSDSNLEIIEINHTGIIECVDAGIETILCTSKFVFNLYNKHIDKNQVPVKAIPAPSRAANLYIASTDEYKVLVARNQIASMHEFKLLKYKQALLK